MYSKYKHISIIIILRHLIIILLRFSTYSLGFIYNIFNRNKLILKKTYLFPNISIKGLNNKIFTHSIRFRKVRVEIDGKNNQINLLGDSFLENCVFFIKGNNNKITISEHTHIKNLVLWIEDNGNVFFSDYGFSMEGGHIALTEGKKIIIGRDCLFSNNIEIRTGDSHSIFDGQGVRINEAKDIFIGNHVWICANAVLLKGTSISNGCIIGNSSLVNLSSTPENAIISGIPGKVIKNGIKWDKNRHINI